MYYHHDSTFVSLRSLISVRLSCREILIFELWSLGVNEGSCNHPRVNLEIYQRSTRATTHSTHQPQQCLRLALATIHPWREVGWVFTG